MKNLIIEVCTGGRSVFVLALSNNLKWFMYFESLFIFLLPPEHSPRLQRAVGSRYIWALAGSRSESEPHPWRWSRWADRAPGAVCPESGPKHEAHLPQPCGAGCSELRWVQNHNTLRCSIIHIRSKKTHNKIWNICRRFAVVFTQYH